MRKALPRSANYFPVDLRPIRPSPWRISRKSFRLTLKLRNSFSGRLDTMTTGLANYKKVEELVAADPSILKRLEEFAASQRKNLNN